MTVAMSTGFSYLWLRVWFKSLSAWVKIDEAFIDLPSRDFFIWNKTILFIVSIKIRTYRFIEMSAQGNFFSENYLNIIQVCFLHLYITKLYLLFTIWKHFSPPRLKHGIRMEISKDQASHRISGTETVASFQQFTINNTLVKSILKKFNQSLPEIGKTRFFSGTPYSK